MPKILILSACLVNYNDDRGGVHAEPADVVAVTAEQARALVGAGRALYENRKDDPSKGGRDSAGADMLKAAEALRKSRDKAE